MAVQSAHLDAKSLALPRAAVRGREQRWLTLLLLVSDILVLELSLTLAYWIRFSSGLRIFDEAGEGGMLYLVLMGVLIVPFVLIFTTYRLYDQRNLWGGTEEYSRIFHACNSAGMLVIFASFIVPHFVVARAWLLMTWAMMIVGCIAARFAIRRWVYHQRQRGRFRARTLLIGANPEGIAVAEQLLSTPTVGARLIGFIDDFEPRGAEPVPGLPVLGGSASFERLVRSNEIDQVIIANSALTRERLLGVYGALDVLSDVEVRLASGLFELLTTGVRVREEGNVPLVTLNKSRIVGIDHLLKTAFDKVAAALLLLVLGVPLLVMALLVRRDSAGPAFHRRRVVGRHNRPFDAFKLRTMYVDGDSRLSDEQRRELRDEGKLIDDPRITRVGRWLRRYSLDELPQLLNVLRGEMSLIGPRMLTAPELEKFGRWQYNLRTVKPGLTGLWQISGRSDLSYEDRVRLDMHYIRNYSIWLDLQILIQTPVRILTGAGAY